MADVQLILPINLLVYTPKAREMFEELCELEFGTISIILREHFNQDLKKKANNESVDFIKVRTGSWLETNRETTRIGSCVDVTIAGVKVR